jgi:hypothetical protein
MWRNKMRKLGLLLLMLLIGSILATPAFAQTGGSTGTPTNWVTIASVLAIAIAAGLAAHARQNCLVGVRGDGSQSRCASRDLWSS